MNASIAVAAVCAVFALALASTEPSPAAGSAQNDVQPIAKSATVATGAPERVVCRQETVTGSRFTRRVCHKASEWSARTEAARQGFFEVQNRPVVKIGDGQ